MMKLASTTAVAALLLAAAPAFAQTATSPAAEPATTAATPAAPTANIQYVGRQMEGQWLASEVIGETVRGPNNDKIGEISNLLLDKDGKVMAAVIGVGGFLGIGQKDVAVPFTDLKLSNERDGDITLAATEEQLRNAPQFMDLDDADDSAAATGMPANTTPARPVPGVTPAPAPVPAPAQ
jgi:hypothetical protein